MVFTIQPYASFSFNYPITQTLLNPIVQFQLCFRQTIVPFVSIGIGLSNEIKKSITWTCKVTLFIEKW